MSGKAMVKKLCKSKKLSNYRVVMLKNPLQVTCDLQRVFQHDHFFFLSILKKLVKSQSGHAEKPFAVHM
jgi:hypothetical protein